MKTFTNSFLTRSLILIFIFITVSFNSSAQTPETSKFITIDQFGYLPNSKKVAVIRNPVIGYDSLETFSPGSVYALINSVTGEQVFNNTPVIWQNGATDASSGDKVWWFDFSTLKNKGKYYVLDVDSNLRSYEFEIREDIYSDAGDYNKYTNWTANYVTDFMKAFLENPGVWGDDYNIPESGNHVPDILDEAKWGIDHLLRLQRTNGSMLSVLGASHESPPSAAKGATYYGTPNTSGTLNSAAAFALASKVYRSVGMKTYADSLKSSAIRAWDWAIENPNVMYNNNSGNYIVILTGNDGIWQTKFLKL